MGCGEADERDESLKGGRRLVERDEKMRWGLRKDEGWRRRTRSEGRKTGGGGGRWAEMGQGASHFSEGGNEGVCVCVCLPNCA